MCATARKNAIRFRSLRFRGCLSGPHMNLGFSKFLFCSGDSLQIEHNSRARHERYLEASQSRKSGRRSLDSWGIIDELETGIQNYVPQLYKNADNPKSASAKCPSRHPYAANARGRHPPYIPTPPPHMAPPATQTHPSTPPLPLFDL